jgi:hypothetical protein
MGQKSKFRGNQTVAETYRESQLRISCLVSTPIFHATIDVWLMSGCVGFKVLTTLLEHVRVVEASTENEGILPHKVILATRCSLA